MHRFTWSSAAAVTACLLAASTVPAAAVHVADSAAQLVEREQQGARAMVVVRLAAAVRQLPVAKETRAGYDRDKFNLWVDADGDCRDTRDEVLAQESKVTVSGCDITRGKWRSYYDGRTWRRSSDVDIDHLVPLAEAWDSGAKRWDANTRERYANDLGDRRSLVAVTDNVNQSKGDQDIAEWLPKRAFCRYVVEWVAVKTRWSLQVDRAEKRFSRSLAQDCGNPPIRVTEARIGTGGGGGGGGSQPLGRMRIARVVYDPPGSDTENAETVTLVNRGRRAQLQGFRLRDRVGASYTLPAYRVGPGGSVVVHSGNGRNRRGHLYAGWGFVWNNDGDTARLLKPRGPVIDTCSWGDGSGAINC